MILEYSRQTKRGVVVASELCLLVDRCLDGQQSAFRELIQKFQGPVFGLCYRMLGQREEAEDAMQETFVRVVRNLHRWDPERAFEPWLLTIAGNRCRTRLAKRKRRPKSQTLDYPIQDSSHLETAANHLAEEVAIALKGVRDEYKQAFLLFYKRQLCYAEIAKQMNIPLGTVKTWVHRARRELIDRLKKRGTIDG